MDPITLFAVAALNPTLACLEAEQRALHQVLGPKADIRLPRRRREQYIIRPTEIFKLIPPVTGVGYPANSLLQTAAGPYIGSSPDVKANLFLSPLYLLTTDIKIGNVARF